MMRTGRQIRPHRRRGNPSGGIVSGWGSLGRGVGIVLLLVAVVSTSGCAYFNTFYLARKHFEEAEHQRRLALQREQPVPATATDLYRRSLHFATKVLIEYPESRWVEDALLISQIILYHQGQMPASVRKSEELQQAFPQSDRLPESRLYLAYGLLALGREADATVEAARAGRGLTGTLRAEARLLEARGLLHTGRTEEARDILEELAYDPGIPPEVMLEARLETARLLERQGLFMEASESLTSLLEDPSLRRSLRIQTTLRRIDLLLQAHELDAVETEVARLNELDTTGFYRGVARYFRGQLIAAQRGETRRASTELVMALRDGVAPDWEARIRLDLADHFETIGSYNLAYAEYRAVTGGQGSTAQKEHARRRMDDILQLFSLRALASRHEPIAPFPDPRAGQGAGARTVPGQPARGGPPGGRVDPDLALARGIVEQEDAAEDERPPMPEVPIPAGTYLFLLAEHWQQQMARPDSARHYLDLAIRLNPDSPVAPQGLFALTEWYRDTPDRQQEGVEAARRLLEDYPESIWAWRYRTIRRGEQGLPLPAEIEAEQTLREVEEGVALLADPSVWVSAVEQYRLIVQRFPDTPAAALAALAAARLIEKGAGPPDSARAAYEQVVARYPDSVEGWMAAIKLADGALPSSRPDPFEARLSALQKESEAWATWLQRQQPAQVNRLQPGAQRLGRSVPTGGAEPPATVPPPRPPTGGGVIPPAPEGEVAPPGEETG